MKILNVICSTDPAHGGPMEWVRQYGMVAKRMGHIVEILSMDSPDSNWLANYPLRVYPMGHGFRYLFNPRVNTWLKAHAHDYDHVLIHGLWRYPSFGAWWTMRSIGLPYSIYTHGMLGPWFKRHYPLKHLAKWLYWPWADYRVLRDADKVFFTCEQEREHARESFWLYQANESVAPMGIAEPDFSRESALESFFSQFPKLRNKRILLFLGRLHTVKGCNLLIEAFARVCMAHPDLQLVMAGPDSGGIREELTALSIRLGISDHISWTDMLTGDAKWGAICAADAVVLSSHHENFSFSTVEALACHTPVLLSNQVGIWREVSRYHAGLVAPDTLEGTTALLKDWLSLDEKERKILGVNARQCFLENFEVVSATTNLLNKLDPVN